MHLAVYMKSHGLTDQDVAKSVNRHQSTINRIRNGVVVPDWNTMLVLYRWSKGRVTPNDFLDGLNS